MDIFRRSINEELPLSTKSEIRIIWIQIWVNKYLIVNSNSSGVAEFLSQLWIIHDDAAPDIEHILDAAVTKCYIGYLFWKMSNLQKKHQTRNPRFCKVAGQSLHLPKNRTPLQVFSCEFSEIFQHRFYIEQL